ncbi:sugar ABC transporter ATP-binding protein [Rhizobium rhizogenes]|uniref:Sugar ABC transporter ATP-binding protein n=1 Tax=Rhizobium rhizogenes TaxID=359 RepID=A0AA92C031_RHIRH|nr:sugar ABC transporter ATP-binding protein [Rhizobium rhizogenes]PVE50702.1 sugar ABC transporter ATP-binding protein [Rhizobium rhizogenes]PVE62435.1 sugar ABC transporter ATP-binding protein [Agrobacterium tumefaciens]PVE70618.1 sugar ABC transporter ATP-binding protein [Sphingomonas sp. TPD3009]
MSAGLNTKTQAGASAPAIEFVDVSKVYDGKIAVARIDHAFDAGRVHALMGKNGSGKSTLVKILSGSVEPTLGYVKIDGERTALATPRDAFAAGIITVHQELSLVPSLSVAENIYLGRMPKKAVLGVKVVDWDAVNQQATSLLREMGLDIDPRTLVSELSVGQQQIIEIAKAMSFDPRILLLDEPTSALASREVEQLFNLIRRLRERGVTMIYITHRMNELFEIADTCTVIRDGHYIGGVEMVETSPSQIIEMMFGDMAKAKRPARKDLGRGTPVLSVKNLSRGEAFRDISFDLFPGEILGFAGLLGSGRTEILKSVFGADPFDSGTIEFDGRPIAAPTPRAMKKRGLGYTPENRKEAGLVQALSSHDNLCLASLSRISANGVITKSREQPFVRRQIADLAIKVPDPMLPVSSLSGGNQQKIVIGNWLNTSPKVMFFDEPSRGVDVQARQQIFEIIWRQAAQGLACVFVSSELEELLEVADRIIILKQGRQVGTADPATTDLTDLYRMCMEGADQ